MESQILTNKKQLILIQKVVEHFRVYPVVKLLILKSKFVESSTHFYEYFRNKDGLLLS